MQIMQTQYTPTPTGLVGNDDLGQMSAWYIFTALGFYPVAPGSNQYVIGRPFIEKATLNLPGGKHFVVSTDHLDAKHPYIGKVTLNGQPLDRTFVRHEEIVAGGELHFTMQAEPAKTWGQSPASLPYSMTPSAP